LPPIKYTNARKSTNAPHMTAASIVDNNPSMIVNNDYWPSSDVTSHHRAAVMSMASTAVNIMASMGMVIVSVTEKH
jgi:hypothetical protein